MLFFFTLKRNIVKERDVQRENHNAMCIKAQKESFQNNWDLKKFKKRHEFAYFFFLFFFFLVNNTTMSESMNIFDRLASGEQKYPEIIKAAVITSSISIFSCILIILSYIYLKTYHSNKANRVSLRCVFLASIMNLINSTFNIFTLLQCGNTTLCKASSVVTMFSRVMGAAFLTIVGINLVLVFVFNVAYTANQLERIYYPGTLLFGLITAILPIVDLFKNHNEKTEYSHYYSCYHYTYYHRLFDKSDLLWVSFRCVHK